RRRQGINRRRETLNPKGPRCRIVGALRAPASYPTSTRRRSGFPMSDALKDLTDAGVSLWLDDLSRERLRTGNLADLIAHRHITGVTSNPTIFSKALSDGAEYAPQVAELKSRGADVNETARTLMTDDVRHACDLFAATFSATDGIDGRVSIEVEPSL